MIKKSLRHLKDSENLVVIKTLFCDVIRLKEF